MSEPRIIIHTEDDMKILNKALDYNVRFRVGRNSQATKSLNNKFMEKMTQIRSIKPGENGEYIGGNTGGAFFSKMNGGNKEYYIEYFSTMGKTNQQKKDCLEVAVHEVSHAYSTFMPMIYRSPNSKIRICNNMYKNGTSGRIEKYSLDGRLIKEYGKMAIETTNDIITYAMMAKFEPGYATEDVDTILKVNYKAYGGRDISAYTFLTSLTKMMLGAFANAKTSYERILDKNLGIADIPYINQKGKRMQANDFLYGMLCDPIHIQMEYDKIMGDGKYEELSDILDSLYEAHMQNRRLDPAKVKRVMTVVPEFANKKFRIGIANGTYIPEDKSGLVGDFNSLWNSMQRQYETYFSKQEIEAIGRSK